jgi:anti-sigma B factor antagonist
MAEEETSSKKCEIEVEPAGEAMVVDISGHIGELDAERVSSVLDGLFGDGKYKIIFDLTDVSYMTSSGLGQIMRAYRVARDYDGYIRIVNPQSLVSDIFRITKLNHIFEIYTDRDSALNPPS